MILLTLMLILSATSFEQVSHADVTLYQCHSNTDYDCDNSDSDITWKWEDNSNRPHTPPPSNINDDLKKCDNKYTSAAREKCRKDVKKRHSSDFWNGSDAQKGLQKGYDNIKKGWDVLRGVGTKKQRQRRERQKKHDLIKDLDARIDTLKIDLSNLHGETSGYLENLNDPIFLTDEAFSQKMHDATSSYNDSAHQAMDALPQEGFEYKSKEHGVSTPEVFQTQDGRYFNNYVKKKIAEENGPHRKEQEALTLFADAAFDNADRLFLDGKSIAGSNSVGLGIAAADFALNFIPGVSWGRDVYEAVTGVNLVTGEQLDDVERGFAVLGAVTGGVGSKGKGAYAGIKAGMDALDKLNDSGKAGEGLARGLDKAGGVVESAKNAGAKSPRGVEAYASKTEPTLPKGSKPRGEPETPKSTANPDEVRAINRQNESATKLADDGFDVEQLPNGAGGGINPDKSPDFLINGKRFDAYAPAKDTSLSGISRKIETKSKTQAERIVLNLEDSIHSKDAVVNHLKNYPKNTENLEELIIIKGGEATQHFHFRNNYE